MGQGSTLALLWMGSESYRSGGWHNGGTFHFSLLVFPFTYSTSFYWIISVIQALSLTYRGQGVRKNLTISAHRFQSRTLNADSTVCLNPFKWYQHISQLCGPFDIRELPLPGKICGCLFTTDVVKSHWPWGGSGKVAEVWHTEEREHG